MGKQLNFKPEEKYTRYMVNLSTYSEESEKNILVLRKGHTTGTGTCDQCKASALCMNTIQVQKKRKGMDEKRNDIERVINHNLNLSLLGILLCF